MCGLLFEFNTKGLTDPTTFKSLLSRSQKRGPDHTGYWCDNKTVQIGFNRLAILELSPAGDQPMLSPSGRYVIVFNGEIYNHLELRKQLHFKKFKGHSDTETITACMEEWGVDSTIEQLDGMFAIVIYDRQSGEVILVRDFAGIKPLFYGWDGKTLVAASQYDQVAKHPAFVDQPIDEQVLKLYLQQHFLPAPFGLLKHTFQVEPGEQVHISATGQIIKQRYWTFPDFHPHTFSDHAKAIEVIDEALSAAVRQELLSDVPLGAFLSGGIDSPLIAHYALRYQQPLKTFTIGSDSTVHDESIQAAQYAELLGSSHTTSMMSDTAGKDMLQEVLACMHEPMADFSIIPTFLVSKLARQQVTVALSGDGGDELFFGYERFWSIAKNIRYQHLPWVIKAGLYKTDQWMSGNRRINSAVLNPRQAHAHERLHSRFGVSWLHKVFPQLINVNLPEAYNTYTYGNSQSENELIQRMRKAEFYGMMQKTLRKVDLASMNNSLEVRVPYLKKTFIEASLMIDPFLSYGAARKKTLLKDLLQKRIRGSQVDEVKRGFTIPLGKWMRNGMKDQFHDLLSQSSFINTYGISSPDVEDLLQSHQKGSDLKWPIFTLTALSAWQQQIKE